MEIASFVINGILAAITIASTIIAIINRKAAKKSAIEAAEYASNANAANLAIAEHYNLINVPSVYAGIEEEGTSIILKVINNSISLAENIKVIIEDWDELVENLTFDRSIERRHADDINVIRNTGFSLLPNQERTWTICYQSSDLASRIIEKESLEIEVSFLIAGKAGVKILFARPALFSSTIRRIARRKESVPFMYKGPEY